MCLGILVQYTKNVDVCSHFNHIHKCSITFTRPFQILKLCMKHYRVFRFCVEEIARYVEDSCEYIE
jgi:ferritin